MGFNSKIYSFSEIVVNVGSKDMTLCTGVKFATKRTMEHVIAAGDEAVAIKPGSRTRNGELMLLQGDFEALNQAAIEAGGKDVTDVSFNIVVNFTNTETMSTYTLKKCRISDFEIALKVNDPKAEITLPFLFIDLMASY